MSRRAYELGGENSHKNFFSPKPVTNAKEIMVIHKDNPTRSSSSLSSSQNISRQLQFNNNSIVDDRIPVDEVGPPRSHWSARDHHGHHPHHSTRVERRSSLHSSNLFSQSITDSDKLRAGVESYIHSSTPYEPDLGEMSHRRQLSRFIDRQPDRHDDDYRFSTPHQSLRVSPFHHSTLGLIPALEENLGTNWSRGASPSSQHAGVDVVKRIADDIIKEKDLIINSQKSRINELESRARSSQVTDQEQLLRDLQIENRSLREQLCSGTATLSTSAALDKQLCELEYKLDQLKKSSRKDLQARDITIADLNREISDQKLDIDHLETKLSERESELKEVHRDLESRLNYLSSLPTVDEHKANLAKISELEKALEESQRSCKELTSRVKDQSVMLSSRDRDVIKMKKEMADVKKQIEDVTTRNKELEDEAAKNVDIQEMRQVKESNDKLTREMEMLKKVYEAKVKQLQVKLSDSDREKKRMKEMMATDESTVSSLKEEAVTKEGHIGSLTIRVKELLCENEKLQDELDRVKNERKFFQGMKSEQECRLFAQLMDEFNSSFDELKVIIRICKEKSEGKDPDLDDLIGTKSLVLKLNEEERELNKRNSGDPSSTSLEMLQKKFQQVKELRRDVDFLRGELADLVAEDLGRRMTCTVQ